MGKVGGRDTAVRAEGAWEGRGRVLVSLTPAVSRDAVLLTHSGYSWMGKGAPADGYIQ